MRLEYTYTYTYNCGIDSSGKATGIGPRACFGPRADENHRRAQDGMSVMVVRAKEPRTGPLLPYFHKCIQTKKNNIYLSVCARTRPKINP